MGASPGGPGSGLTGVNGIAVAAAAAGILLIWSGIKGAKVTTALRSVLSGKQPAGTNAYPLTGAQLAAGASGLSGGSASGSAIASDALQYQGKFPYVWGGAPASGGSDCSGFANEVIGHDCGMAIPGYAPGAYTGSAHGPTTLSWLAWSGCKTIGHSGSVAEPGDLAIWQTHMGICTGPNQMISAQDPQNGTQVSAIDGFIPEFLYIRRLQQ